MTYLDVCFSEGTATIVRTEPYQELETWLQDELGDWDGYVLTGELRE
jgi:hypothetical protein